MKALLKDQVIAEAAKDELIYIEGNWYFPPASAMLDLLEKSPTAYTCPWKGACQYWNVDDIKDAAWSYDSPIQSGIDRVGKDFTGYLAFDKSHIELSE
ncbi:DUF427 domain-containing protein [Aeromicrobium sp.]|nr:DUF427 domain-containing protein [Candidatus Saccharibacteria bacterium]